MFIMCVQIEIISSQLLHSTKNSLEDGATFRLNHSTNQASFNYCNINRKICNLYILCKEKNITTFDSRKNLSGQRVDE